MAQRFRFIAVTVLSILVLTIVGAVLLSPAYAPPTPGSITLYVNGSVSPSPVFYSTTDFSLTYSGTSGAADVIHILLYSGSGCSVYANSYVVVTADATTGAYTKSVIPDNDPGSYSAQAAVVSGVNKISNCVNLTIDPAPTIPEYPFGLAVLAIFMTIAYGVIRQRTRYGQS
jgi:hypothetical protein